MTVIPVSAPQWAMMMNGGYMVVACPTKYDEVFSYAGSFCVWRREVIL